MKIAVVLGTRPEFIKLAPVVRAFDSRHDFFLCHTGQHYSFNMNELFFRELKSRMQMRCYVFMKFEAVERYMDLLLMGFLLLEKRRLDDLVSTGKWPAKGDAIMHWRTTDRLRNLESWIQRFNLDYISKRLESKRGRAELVRKLAGAPCQIA